MKKTKTLIVVTPGTPGENLIDIVNNTPEVVLINRKEYFLGLEEDPEKYSNYIRILTTIGNETHLPKMSKLSRN